MTSKKSCVLIVENLPLPFDRRVWQEANALKEDGWEVSAICPKTEKCPESYVEMNGIHIYRHHLPIEASGKMGFILEYATALFHEFRLLLYIHFKHGFQVIQGCNPPDLIFIPAMFFKIFGKKYIFDHHDICPELFAVKFGKKGALHKALLFFEKLSYRWSNAVITANDTFKDLCVKRTGVTQSKVTAVYSVPDKKNIHRVEGRTDLHKSKKLLIGYIGIIGNQDGVDHLVQAMAALKNDMGLDDFAAVIIGDGPDLDNIKAMANDLGVAERITFTGYLTGEELLKALSAIDIGVIPDPFNEYGGSDTNESYEDYKSALLVVLTRMRSVAGDVPVFINPVGGRTDGQQNGYQTIRRAQQDLASETEWIYLCPERFDNEMEASGSHHTAAGYANQATRIVRKIMSVLGETVTGGVDGPVITNAERTGTTVTVTLSHDEGTDFTPTSAIEGFEFWHGENGDFSDTEIAITNAVRTNETTITLTLDSAPTGSIEKLYYGSRALYGVTLTNLVKDNDANGNLPLRSAEITL